MFNKFYKDNKVQSETKTQTSSYDDFNISKNLSKDYSYINILSEVVIQPLQAKQSSKLIFPLFDLLLIKSGTSYFYITVSFKFSFTTHCYEGYI